MTQHSQNLEDKDKPDGKKTPWFFFFNQSVGWGRLGWGGLGDGQERSHLSWDLLKVTGSPYNGGHRPGFLNVKSVGGITPHVP